MKSFMMASVLSASALAIEPGPILWGQIRSSMTSAEVAVIYPAAKGVVEHKLGYTVLRRAQAIGKCTANVTISYTKGRVSQVLVSSRLTGFPATSCIDDAKLAMIAKYGTPTREEIELGDRVSYWSRGQVLVRFERPAEGSDETWYITYIPIFDTGL